MADLVHPPAICEGSVGISVPVATVEDGIAHRSSAGMTRVRKNSRTNSTTLPGPSRRSGRRRAAAEEAAGPAGPGHLVPLKSSPRSGSPCQGQYPSRCQRPRDRGPVSAAFAWLITRFRCRWIPPELQPCG
jgi:hypothetical protein